MQRLLSQIITLAFAVGMSTMSTGAADAVTLGTIYQPAQPTIDIVRDRRDCHNFTHNHYVPEWDVVTPHHHKGPYCIPIQDENDDDIPEGYDRYNFYDDGRYLNFNDRYRRRHHDNYYGCNDPSVECLAPDRYFR